jgi:dienelactone hydrolase
LVVSKHRFSIKYIANNLVDCWGSKLASLISGSDSPWKAAVSSSPARIDPSDAEKCTIPFATLASKDENADEVKAFHEALTIPKAMHIFEDQVHGWMSARADLKDDRMKAEYERGYQITLDFFAEHL